MRTRGPENTESGREWVGQWGSGPACWRDWAWALETKLALALVNESGSELGALSVVGKAPAWDPAWVVESGESSVAQTASSWGSELAAEWGAPSVARTGA